MPKMTTSVPRRRRPDEVRRLVAVMDRRGLGAQEFAERVGVTSVTVYRWQQQSSVGQVATSLVPVLVLDGGASRPEGRIAVLLRSDHRLRLIATSRGLGCPGSCGSSRA